MRADLHCHTTVSDGSMEPADLVDYAARVGLDCVAITDHDSMDGVKEAAARAAQRGVKLVPGIEVSTYDYRHDKKVHLLCYAPVNPEPMLELCARTLAGRNAAALKIVEKVSSKYPLDMAAVWKYAAGSAAVYKQHIVLALAQMGYSLSVFGGLFGELFSSKSGWARVDVLYPDTRDALALIKETGGAAVLAHPGVYRNFDMIDELCGMGLDGIEVNHPRQSAEDEKAAREAAHSHGIFMTGGSDFHGMFSSTVNPLASRTAPEEDLQYLLSALKGL